MLTDTVSTRLFLLTWNASHLPLHEEAAQQRGIRR